MEEHLCACGCGKETKKILENNKTFGYKKGEYHIYILGHHTRGKKLTDEHKLNISKARKGKPHSKEWRNKSIKNLKPQLLGSHLSIDICKKISIKAKGRLRTKEQIEKHRQKMLGRKLSKESIEKRTATRKENSEKRGYWHSKEHNAKISYLSTIQKINHKFKKTKIELIIKAFLEEASINHIFQHYVDIPHRYVADFYLPDKNIIIEADGNYWHKYPNGTEKDKLRTQEMQEKGMRVLRFWEHDINNNFDMVKNIILREVNHA